MAKHRRKEDIIFLFAINCIPESSREVFIDHSVVLTSDTKKEKVIIKDIYQKNSTQDEIDMTISNLFTYIENKFIISID